MPILNIDFFINLKQGVCRHNTVILIELLRQLIKKGYLPTGDIFHYRTELEGIPHAMVIYRTGPHLFLLDPAQSDCFDLKSEDRTSSVNYRNKHQTDGANIIQNILSEYGSAKKQLNFNKRSKSSPI